MLKKNKALLLVPLTIMTFALIGSAIAEVPEGPTLDIHISRNIWNLNTITVDYGPEDINTTTLQPYYYNVSDLTQKIYIDPAGIQKTTIKGDVLVIFFYGVYIPKHAANPGVEGTYTDGVQFLSTTAGFAWRRR